MIETLYSSYCILGEAPVWHRERQSCFWADIETGVLYEYHLGKESIQTYHLKKKVSLIIPAAEDELILGVQGGVARYRLSKGTWSWISQLDTDWANFRCNDGGADIMGRVWVSTTDLNHRFGAGAIYCLEKDNQSRTEITDISIPNGIVWSPDNRKMYYTDSLRSEIYALDFDECTGKVGPRNMIVRIAQDKGLPDGMAVDSLGYIWIALWGGYGLGRFNPENGEMTDFISVPVPNVTSCCFVGKDLDKLLITTARKEMSDELLSRFPESGNTFITKTKIKGIPTHCARI